jgi:trans-aconitate methyltransferase
MLAQARSAHPDATWVRADVRAMPFAEDFDLAVTFGALGHFLPTERPALFEGVYRALRPGGLFAFPIGAPAPLTSVSHWATLGFDLAMRVRNAVCAAAGPSVAPASLHGCRDLTATTPRTHICR